MECRGVSDKVLWGRCRHGDEGAFNAIFNRYFPRMLDVAESHVKDSMKAEELVMDCFFNLWVKRGQIEDGNFLNYLFRSVRNSIISHYRREIPLVLGLEQAENKCHGGHSPDSGFLSEDISEVYRKALGKLTPRRRQIFLLSRDENLSYAEIARRMNLSVSTVDNYITTALESLRVNMKGVLSLLMLFFHHL